MSKTKIIMIKIEENEARCEIDNSQHKKRRKKQFLCSKTCAIIKLNGVKDANWIECNIFF